MKVSLVVSEGVHQGKVIPVTVKEFLIGRDPECQLRPASPQVSKKHCAVVVRDGKVFVRDFGSTNGTFINDEQVAGEIEVKTGDKFRAGPLAFDIQIELTAANSASAAAPATSKPATAAVKPAVTAKAAPAPKPEPKAAPVAVTSAAESVPTEASEGEQDPDQMAALLLGGDDGSGDITTEGAIPDGTTVMELPAVAGEKKDDKKKDGDTSSAAAAILSKYMRRPRS
jgi:pSer/pThr/pTyr-binding forkhead associated (FHA) protein